MDEYPDPDEEFELMYGDELELLREQEEDYEPQIKKSQPAPISRKSLDFGESTNTAKNDSFSDFRELPNSQIQTSQDIRIINENTFDTELQNVEGIVGNTLSQGEILPSNNKKRSAEELFGDITDLDDIFLEMDVPTTKKSKTDDIEEKLAMIDHIIEMRQLAKQKCNIISITSKNNEVNTIERDKRNISYRVPKYPFIGLTRFDNERVYVRFHSEEYEKEEIQRIVKETTFSGVMGEVFKEVWKDAKNLVDTQNILSTQNISESSGFVETEEDETTKLWVDLYKPRRYLELLSDESTNRIMLRWIKLWDKVVFNRKPKIKPIKPTDEKYNLNNQKKFFKPQFELDTELDEHGRPKYKVALLCGPPGLGKTTLAHMVAKHAGYKVVEINASDDRSTDAFKTALENATQMKSVVDQEGRPNCLIFDEIDGAPQSSIEYLIKFVNGTATKKSKKGKAQSIPVLKRPIICICNDVYVPALRPLRQIAFIVNFPPTASARLAERLMNIARWQQIKTDIGAMMALAEKSNNDIRSCLSVLHFFKAQNKPVRLADIYKANVGQKDMQKGLFSVWNDIFHIDQPKVQPGQRNIDTNYVSKYRMNKILQVISSFGDYNRVAQGVFENYPLLTLKNSSFDGICKSLEWFIFSDLINTQIQSLQNYSTSNYLQYAFVVWHFVFATSTRQKINYPNVGYEMRQKESRQIAIVSEVLRGLQPSVRSFCNRLTLILDILPLLVIIIVPKFRPVNLHLYTKEEKAAMLAVVNIMIDYNLNYVQERQNDGTFTFNLEPNIETVANIDKTEAFRRKTVSYSNRQLIAREIEMEKMRRHQQLAIANNREINTSKSASNKTTTAGGSAGANLPNHLQTLKAKAVKVNTPVVKRDFFGRVIVSPKNSGKTGGSDHTKDIWYSYKEGYSNAVRKTITISYLK